MRYGSKHWSLETEPDRISICKREGERKNEAGEGGRIENEILRSGRD